jgi:glycosyltransferase involved in cell wall biosynthesis
VVKGSADIRWRVELPVRHLKAKLVSMSPKDSWAFIDPNKGGKFKWEATDEGADYPEHEGVAVWTRPDQRRATHALAMRMNGVRTIAEVDDNFTSPKDQNIFMRMNDFGPVARRAHLQAMCTFNGIVYSTAWLRDEYLKAFKRDKLPAPDAFVCRNHVDPDDWGQRRRPLFGPGLRLRVGWMGSHQHIWDLRLAAPALRLAADMGCEVVFVGLDPATHDPEWRKFLGDYTHIPWVDPRNYHKTSLNFDIGLIPLVYNKHTSGKSDVKFLEYAMSGAAVVAQSTPVYNKTIVHGETGLLASSPDDMAYKMADLIRHQRQRENLTASAKQWVLENRTMQNQGVHEWREAVSG